MYGTVRSDFPVLLPEWLCLFLAMSAPDSPGMSSSSSSSSVDLSLSSPASSAPQEELERVPGESPLESTSSGNASGEQAGQHDVLDETPLQDLQMVEQQIQEQFSDSDDAEEDWDCVAPQTVF